MKPVLVGLAALACASASAGERRVIEHDVGDFSYRRFQKLEDIEFRIEGNSGVGWTAVYQRKDTLGGGSIVPVEAIAIAFVTEYDRGGVQVDARWLSGYQGERDKGVYVLRGQADVGAGWPSG